MRKFPLLMLVLIISTLFSAACLRIYLVSKDKYDDNFVVHRINPRTSMFGPETKVKLYLAPQMITQPGKETIYNFITIQRARDESLLVETIKGKNLAIVIDGQRYEFETAERIYGETGIESSEYPLWRHRIHDMSGIIIENTSFDGTLDVMEKIAEAKKVEVILTGKDGTTVQKKFLEQHFEIFKSFVKYVHKKTGR